MNHSNQSLSPKIYVTHFIFFTHGVQHVCVLVLMGHEQKNR